MSNSLKLRSLLSSPQWLVEEKEFDVNKINFYETIFTIGNGYLGNRGSLEEGHHASLKGTYINGVFDHFDSFIIDLVNAPDWSELSVWVESEKLSIHNCELLTYYRALDMKQGLLYRATSFKDRYGRITHYESIRYASFANRNQFEIKISITPENYSGNIKVEAPINGTVFNLDLEPNYREKPEFIPEAKWGKWTNSKHLGYVDSGNHDEGIFLEMKTLERPYHIFYGSNLSIKNIESKQSNLFDYENVCQTAEFNATQGVSYQIEKVSTIFTSRDVPKNSLKKASQELLKNSLQLSFENRFKQHQLVWQKKWEDCDIIIEGDNNTNHAVRFNIYHLLITANELDHKANIGAKSLSGEGYKGHVFWDTEIFLLPFYIYTQPDTAKALLMYRFYTLEDAKQYAKENGCEGARYAWESTDTGLEATPPWTADGVNRIWTGERELHITSAVAFGVLFYMKITNDSDFLINYGSEILFETARFWDSRLEFNVGEDRYELTEVEGPDEFHELVNNSVYTNWLTKWSLEESYNCYFELQKKHPQEIKKLITKLKLTNDEVEEWKRKALKIYIPFDENKKLVEEFEGYFDLKDIPISKWDKNDMPVYPDGYDHFNCDETTLIKQPDVVMLMYILPDEFTPEIKKINYEYYEKRTMHKSSLSPSIHTIMGIETDNNEKAFQYFEKSAYVDLIDNQGNTDCGMHIASAGGTWQAIVNGFAGLRIKNGQLTFKPWMPKQWKSVQFKIKWQNNDILIKIFPKRIQFTVSSQLDIGIVINLKGKEIKLPSNKATSVNYI